MDDPYATLGVSRTASAGEIRAKYLAAIKTSTPEGDPARFRLVSEAYRILSNPDRRKAYDAQERIPPEVEAELLACQRLPTSEDAQEMRRLEALHRQHSHLRAVRFAYAVALDRAKRHGEAIPIFRSLHEECPSEASYATWLGDAYIHAGQAARGVPLLQEAILLDPADRAPYVCLARHHVRQKEFAEAIRILDRALEADGKIDIADCHVLIERLFLIASQDRWDDLHRSIAQITSLLPDHDTAGRAYLASQLWPVVEVFDKAGRRDLEILVIDAVLALDPGNDKLRRAADGLRPFATRMRERTMLLADEDTPKWLRAFVYVLTEEASNAHEERQHRDILDGIGREVSYPNFAAASFWWSKVRKRYPTLMAELQPAWDRLAAIVNTTPETSYTGTHSVSSSGAGNSGCAVLCLLGLLALAVAACS